MKAKDVESFSLRKEKPAEEEEEGPIKKPSLTDRTKLFEGLAERSRERYRLQRKR